MDQWRFVFHLYFLLSVEICLIKAQEIKFFSDCVSNVGKYIDGSPYQTNLRTLQSTLSTNIGLYGFQNSSFGQEPDRAYAVTFCRADVDHDSCQKCVADSVPMLNGLCQGSKEAMGWFEQCMLRYSSRPLTGWLWTENRTCVWDYFNSTSPQLYSVAVRSLLDDLRPKAAAGGSLLKFAVGNATGPDSQSIYAVVQCTPELTEELCNTCLMAAFSQFSSCLNISKGGRIMYPNCYFRFESYVFYNETGVIDALSRDRQPPPLLKEGTNKISNRRKRMVIIIAVSVSSATLIILSVVVSVWLILARRRRKSLQKTDHGMDDVNFEEDTLQCDFETIKAATNDFAEENKLGQGGFGSVYKGKFANGEEIAVKRLSRDKGQGDIEFKNEVMLVAKLQHRNLVRMLGFAMEASERLLVYELLENSSLNHFLFETTIGLGKAIQDHRRGSTRTAIPSRRFKASNYSP
ncbi:cysteine-rich receptor-like protein kinase 10 [Impatiens glandulifera]|uniref:cysteine-rich receptor-like protein kinase 10 n=1 Tax=Impatiens glandulifera TaxID=253017 RepID=UPI001FB16CD3|nr:cysteine-rich receptor-like protein kinase 10 [Impatiens glandulifera]